MVKQSAAALYALLLGGCASVTGEHVEIGANSDRPPIQLRAGDRITVKTTDVSAHVCADESHLMCSYGSGRLVHVSCECQRVRASPATMR